MTPQKRDREPHPRKHSGQPPQGYNSMPTLAANCTKPTNGADNAVTVREDTPCPGTGKMSGPLFEERNWVLSKDYLAIEGKKEDATVARPPPKEEPKMGEQTSKPEGGKVWLGT